MLYPIDLDINNKLCVVIGGGNVALRKIKAILDAGGKVKVIGPAINEEIRYLDVEVIQRPFQKGDLENAFIAIAATDDEVVNRQVADDATENDVLLNVVDKPDLCQFYVPSVVTRGDLVISISTSGKFPALSKKLRKDLESEFGPEYEKYIELLAGARNKVIAKYADLSKRREILQKIAGLDLIRLIKQGESDKAEEEISLCI